MTQTAAALRHLHELRLSLRRVNDQFEAGPRKVTAKRLQLEKRKQELEALRNKSKQLRSSADQKNLQLKTNEAKINDLKAKLNAASSNREYDILKGQVEADTMANSVLEDEILEALEQVDRSLVDIKEGERAVVAAEADLQKALDDVANKEPVLKAELAGLHEQVAAAERFLPGDVTVTYRRLVDSFGADALASVENKACSGCYVGLTMQEVVELKSGKLLFCRSCGRLMYMALE